MSYVSKVLQPGESIIYETKLSWAMYLPGLLLLLVGGLFFLGLCADSHARRVRCQNSPSGGG